ncbi:GspH/FimT family pseudopilin [Elongatibacter sediminis]|uniref:Type II secretion system protein H n=1 Tax=Elongatibacter sediminis TaxID=3119006 RepID=A0AAW9R6G4_9GAMM
MPIPASIRRDPRNTGKGFSAHRGFTVIELMITLAVLAIITSLALPSYRTVLEKRQVTSAAEQISAFLSSVQIESVKRNEPIAVRYARAAVDSWCVGLDNAAATCDCTVTDITDSDSCTVDGELRVLQSSSLNYPGVMSGTTGDGAFVFDPVRGLMIDHTDAAKLHLASSRGKYALDVDVSATGRVKICSSDSSKKVPGYASC